MSIAKSISPKIQKIAPGQRFAANRAFWVILFFVAGNMPGQTFGFDAVTLD
ncbi:hypothetical protein [Endozoicomonas sp. Mp262]